MTTQEETAPIRVRIAPSPTGDPHVGTAYIGLLNYIYARQRNGKFILRIEDTDRTRFVLTSEQMIFEALRWVGLTWDEGPDVGGPFGPYRQSERTEIYRQHADLLLANGAAYRCFCTAEELDASRKQQIAAKLPPRYVGTCRHLTPEQIAAHQAANKPFVIRMAVPTAESTTFRDELRGDITFDHSNVDDQVLIKSDGFPTYHLANVVDDHLMQISDVIRAEEWISSTPKHVLLYKAFGWQHPRFWHMPLLRNLDKSKISKRKNPVSLTYYQQAGFLPEALINFLGLMGGGMPADINDGKEIFTLAEMVQHFVFTNIRVGGPVFDLTKLKWLNGEYLRALTPEAFYTAVRTRVFGDDAIRQISVLMQQRIETLAQFGDLTSFFFRDDVLPTPELLKSTKRNSKDTITCAEELLSALEDVDWQNESIERAINSVGAATAIRLNQDWAEATKIAYRTAVRHFFKAVSNKKARLGKDDNAATDDFETYLLENFTNINTQETYRNAIEAVRDYVEGNDFEWSIKETFMLLRAIITGSTMSPPLIESLIIFGKPRTLDRLRRFLDAQKKLATQKK